MSAHSPGPWTWVQESVGRRVWRLVSATGRAIFWPVPDREAPSIGEMRSTDINCPNEADRALLAEAPELLDTVKRQTRLIHRLVSEMYPDRPGWSEWGEATDLLAHVQGILNRLEPE